MTGITFDYRNLTEVEGGIREDEVSKIQPKLKKAIRDLLDDPTGFMKLPYTAEFNATSVSIAGEVSRSGATDFILIGIGGSALGPVALHSALNHPYYNQLRERRGPRMYFAENADPNTLGGILDTVDLQSTWVNVVTKSGSTAETMANFLVVRQALIEALGEPGYRERTVATTDPEQGYLKRIAEMEGLKTLSIPSDVGGRYSVLSPVGLFPAAVAGIDTEALLSGAAACADEVTEQGAEHPAIVGAAMHYLMHTQRGRNIRVTMPYADSLGRFAAWFVQLWAESLGKDGTGSTPHAAIGATDQHSQLQLYMEGPQDKVIEFIEVAHHPKDIKVPPAYPELDGISYLDGHSLAELLNVECDATRKALTEAGRPNSTIKLDALDERSLGYLIYALEIQTAVAGALYGVNPFDQPGVEAGKKITYARMGRPGY